MLSFKVSSIAAVSRAASLLVSIVSDWIFSDYDTSASARDISCAPDSHERNPRLAGLRPATDASIVWDAVYYDRIRRCGYEFEHFAAFMPGWPTTLSQLAGSSPALWTQAVSLVVTAVAFTAAAALLFECAPCRITAPSSVYMHDVPA